MGALVIAGLLLAFALASRDDDKRTGDERPTGDDETSPSGDSSDEASAGTPRTRLPGSGSAPGGPLPAQGPDREAQRRREDQQARKPPDPDAPPPPLVTTGEFYRRAPKLPPTVSEFLSDDAQTASVRLERARTYLIGAMVPKRCSDADEKAMRRRLKAQGWGNVKSFAGSGIRSSSRAPSWLARIPIERLQHLSPGECLVWLRGTWNGAARSFPVTGGAANLGLGYPVVELEEDQRFGRTLLTRL